MVMISMNQQRHNEQQLVLTQEAEDVYWELMDLWTNCDSDNFEDDDEEHVINSGTNTIQVVLRGTARLVPLVLFNRMGASVNSAKKKQADCMITMFDAQCHCHHHHQLDSRSTADEDQGEVNHNYPECTCPTYWSDETLSFLSKDQDDSTTTTNKRQCRLVADIACPRNTTQTKSSSSSGGSSSRISSRQQEPQTDSDEVTRAPCKERMGTIQVFYDDYNTAGSIIDVQAQRRHHQERLVFLAQRLGRVLAHRYKLHDRESTLAAMQAQQRRLIESQRIAKLGQWDLEITTGALTWSDEIFTLFQINKTKFAASYEAFLNAIHPDDRTFVDQAYKASLETRQPYNIIHRLLRIDGTIRWVNEICRTEYDSQTGNPLYSVGIVQDITELKQAQEMDRLKTRFLANMSHEVRTPINAILGYTDLMLLSDSNEEEEDENYESSSRRHHYGGDSISDDDDDNHRDEDGPCLHQQRRNHNMCLSKRNGEYLRIIRTSGELLMTLISDILDISKIEAGQLLLDNKAFSLDTMLQLCRDSARAFQNTINRNQYLQIVMRNQNDHEGDASNVNADCDNVMADCIMGDPSRIQQVLNNLLNNACKFTDDKHGARVEYGVRLRQQTQQRKTTESDILYQDNQLLLEFYVRDSGVGIPQEKQRDIFEAFHQAHPTRDSHELGGTGLGLTISKRLVELMGGRMWLESSTTDTESQKRGTVVYFTVPYVPAPVTEAATMIIDMADDTIVVEQPSASLHAKAVVKRSSKRMSAIALLPSPASPTESMTSSSTCTNASLNSSPLPPLSNAAQSSSLSPLPPSPVLGKVLIVDDNCVNLKLAVRIVNRLGYDTMTASNGKEAVEVFQKDRAANSVIQCILMDKEMPIMDGLVAVQEIRRIEQLEYQQKLLFEYEHVPIVALTAAAYREDMDACLAAGCDSYLTKPVRREALQEILSLYLDGNQVN